MDVGAGMVHKWVARSSELCKEYVILSKGCD